jgi:ubiquitin carboxyl-terminal hydrolase 10
VLAYYVKDGQQHDSEEFLNLYLDALDEELVQVCAYISTYKPVSAPSVEGLVEGEAQSAEGQTDVGQRGFTASLMESPISQVFGGRSRSTVCIPNQPDTITIQDWRLLRLNVQPDSVHTIRDALALAHVLQPQLPQVGESSSMEASKQVLFESLPPVLVLHLGCSMDDAAVDGIVKITKAIQLAPELEIPLEIMAPVSGRSAEPVPVHYKLYGVLYHHGESTGSGHYTVDVLHPSGVDGSGEAWLHIDDEAVSTVRHEDMFGGHDNERVDDQCAYMLLYCRTAPTQT